jgi:hypothetical protein
MSLRNGEDDQLLAGLASLSGNTRITVHDNNEVLWRLVSIDFC